MKSWTQIRLTLLMGLYKFARVTGNLTLQHIALEEMVLFNTRMRVLKEQRENELLFKKAGAFTAASI